MTTMAGAGPGRNQNLRGLSGLHVAGRPHVFGPFSLVSQACIIVSCVRSGPAGTTTGPPVWDAGAPSSGFSLCHDAGPLVSILTNWS